MAANTLYTRICSIINVGRFIYCMSCALVDLIPHMVSTALLGGGNRNVLLCIAYFFRQNWVSRLIQQPCQSHWFAGPASTAERKTRFTAHTQLYTHSHHAQPLSPSVLRTHTRRQTHAHTHTHTHTHALSHCNTHRLTLSLPQTHTLTLTETWREALRYSPPGFHQSCISVGPRDTCLHTPMSRHGFK